jgi:hypothetical protein
VALNEDRNTRRRTGDQVDDPVAGGETVYAGALVVLDSNGYAAAGRTATGLSARGMAEAFVDNSGGADGDRNVALRRGVFRWGNDGTDTIDRTQIGADAYIVDDETVAANDGSGTRSVAGKIIDVDDDGVWVETG